MKMMDCQGRSKFGGGVCSRIFNGPSSHPHLTVIIRHIGDILAAIALSTPGLKVRVDGDGYLRLVQTVGTVKEAALQVFLTGKLLPIRQATPCCLP